MTLRRDAQPDTDIEGYLEPADDGADRGRRDFQGEGADVGVLVIAAAGMASNSGPSQFT